jgi:two-component system sensor histidine kinase HupT/HoxJ
MNGAMSPDATPLPGPAAPRFDDAAWHEVLQAVDRTYAELVDYQAKLEAKNTELEALRSVMASVLASVSDVLVVAGRDGRIEAASRSVGRRLSGDRPVGTPLADLAAEAGRAGLSAALAEVVQTRRPRTLEVDLRTPLGPAPFEVSMSPRFDERGRCIGTVLTGRPLGELRRAYAELDDSHRALKAAQAQLIRNEKLAALGRLLAGVAHELNNPISFVYANAHALEKYAARFEAYFERVQAGAARAELVELRQKLRLDRELLNLRTAIDGARDGAERVRNIVEDLRRLSADGTGEMVDVDLVDTARVAAHWVERGARRDTAVVFEGAPRLMARGRPGHIQQVVMNLVQNAFDALAATPGPRIVLRFAAENGRAVLEVCDNGPGVPAELAAAIFDPFFTTKEVGKGTGLGLSISHKIAEEHGGLLRLVDRPGPGACFRLELPPGTGA